MLVTKGQMLSRERKSPSFAPCIHPDDLSKISIQPSLCLKHFSGSLVLRSTLLSMALDYLSGFPLVRSVGHSKFQAFPNSLLTSHFCLSSHLYLNTLVPFYLHLTHFCIFVVLGLNATSSMKSSMSLYSKVLQNNFSSPCHCDQHNLLNVCMCLNPIKMLLS